MVTDWEEGLKVYPLSLGVTVYDPAIKLAKVKLPEEFVVVVALAAPVSVIVTPAPLGLTVPERENVGTLPVAASTSQILRL